MSRWPTWTQKGVTFGRVGYQPNWKQAPIHRSRARVVQIVGGERAGKSRSMAMEILARVPWCRRVALVADEYDESRREWQYIADGLQMLGALGRVSTPRHGQWWGQARTGAEFFTVSIHTGVSELTGTGEPFDIVALCEAGLIGFNGFLAARGRVTETRGMVIMSGTLWDNVGWYADMWRMGQGENALGVVSFSLPSWANQALFPGGRDDSEILAWRESLDESEAARRIDAEVRASPARMYPEFSEPVHVSEWAAFNPADDVVLFVDAGYYPSRYSVLAVQFRKDAHGREVVCVVDEVWEHHKVHEDVIAMCKARAWWDHVTQAVGGHETKQHQATSSTAEVWAATAGLYFETFDAGRVLEGARRVRWLLKPSDGRGPRLLLAPGVDGLAWEFGHYRRKTDRQDNVVSEEPEDRYNDALDALRDGVVWRYGLVDYERQADRGEWGGMLKR